MTLEMIQEGHRDSTAVKILALYAANLGLFPHIPYDFPNHATHDPRIELEKVHMRYGPKSTPPKK